jgi:pyruvate carboxylase
MRVLSIPNLSRLISGGLASRTTSTITGSHRSPVGKFHHGAIGVNRLVGADGFPLPIPQGRGGWKSLPIIDQHSADLPKISLATLKDPVMILNRGHGAEGFYRAAKRAGAEHILCVVAKGDTPPSADQHIRLPGSGTAAYLDQDALVHACVKAAAPLAWLGWGLLSENAEFITTLRRHGIMAIAPEPSVVERMGTKTLAREVAIAAGAPVVPGSPLVESYEEAMQWAQKIGFPIMVKAANGGGGKGMRVALNEAGFKEALASARSEAQASFGRNGVFLEKFITGNKQHIEIQLVADLYGNVRAVGTRDCSVQRRNQKVVEIAPAHSEFEYLMEIAERIAAKAGYSGAGTVEFIVSRNPDGTHTAYFMEMNTRLQVESRATEMVTDIDLMGAQYRIAMGESLGRALYPTRSDFDGSIVDRPTPRGVALHLRLAGEALVTVGDHPDMLPTPGAFSRKLIPGGSDVRAEMPPSQAMVSPSYDSNFGVIVVRGETMDEAKKKALVALNQTHFGGSALGNTSILKAIIADPKFGNGFTLEDLPRLITSPEFMRAVRTESHEQHVDLAAKYLATVAVNGPLITGVVGPVSPHLPILPNVPALTFDAPPSWPLYGRVFQEAGGGVAGCEAVIAAWRETAFGKNQVMLAHTRYRDLVQTLLAGRGSLSDMKMVAQLVALLPWMYGEGGGGASVHSNVIFNHTDPMLASHQLNQAGMGNTVLSALGRSDKTYAYGNSDLLPGQVEDTYRAPVVYGGIRLHNIFDGMNDLTRLLPALDDAAKVHMGPDGREYAAIIMPNIVFHTRYKAPEIVEIGLRILAHSKQMGWGNRLGGLRIKDAQGMMAPANIGEILKVPQLMAKHGINRTLWGAHSHNAQQVTPVTYRLMAEAGYRFFDVSGTDMIRDERTQPGVSEVVKAMDDTVFKPNFPLHLMDLLRRHDQALFEISKAFIPFNIVSPTQVSQVGLPPGMTTNVEFQAKEVGIAATEFESAFPSTYGTCLNTLMQITGVTPNSKIAGEMALWIMSYNKGKTLTQSELTEWVLKHAVTAPDSVKGLFQGKIGTPPFGFHKETEAAFKALEVKKPQGAHVPTIADYEKAKAAAIAHLKAKYHREIPEYFGTLSVLFGQKDIEKYFDSLKEFGDYTGELPMRNKLLGIKVGEIAEFTMGKKSVFIENLGISEPNEKGVRNVTMRVDGHLMVFPIKDKRWASSAVAEVRMAKANVSGEVGAPMPGTIIGLLVQDGAEVKAGTPILTTEAMKMQNTIVAKVDGTIKYHVKLGEHITAEQLLAVVESSVG